MALTHLPPQPPMSPEAERYAAWCIAHTAQAQACTNHVLDIPYGSDYWHKLDIYLPEAVPTGRVPVLCSCMVAIGPTATKTGWDLWRQLLSRCQRFLFRSIIGWHRQPLIPPPWKIVWQLWPGPITTCAPMAVTRNNYSLGDIRPAAIWPP